MGSPAESRRGQPNGGWRSPAASAPGRWASTAATPTVPTSRSVVTNTAGSGGKTGLLGSTSTSKSKRSASRRVKEKAAGVTATSGSDIYYDPFDVELDVHPHPMWKRMRDEAPLYYNEKFNFFALSRF